MPFQQLPIGMTLKFNRKNCGIPMHYNGCTQGPRKYCLRDVHIFLLSWHCKKVHAILHALLSSRAHLTNNYSSITISREMLHVINRKVHEWRNIKQLPNSYREFHSFILYSRLKFILNPISHWVWSHLLVMGGGHYREEN